MSTARDRDVLEAIDRLLELRVGNGDSDVNPFDIQQPVSRHLLERIRDEIVSLRSMKDWIVK